LKNHHQLNRTSSERTAETQIRDVPKKQKRSPEERKIQGGGEKGTRPLLWRANRLVLPKGATVGWGEQRGGSSMVAYGSWGKNEKGWKNGIGSRGGSRSNHSGAVRTEGGKNHLGMAGKILSSLGKKSGVEEGEKGEEKGLEERGGTLSQKGISKESLL